MYKLKPGATNPKFLIPYMGFIFCITFFDNISLLIALPLIQKDNDWTNSQAQWILTSFLVATTSCAIPLSRLGEKLGFVNIQLLYLSLTIVLDIGMFFTINFYGFLALRFLFGAVTAGLLGSKDILIRLLPNQENIQKSVFIMIQTGNYICLIGPAFAGFLVQYIPWKYTFIIGIFFSLSSIVCLIFIEQPPIIQKNVKFDFIGSLLLVIFVLCFCFVFSFCALFKTVYAVISLVLGCVFCTIFYFFEKRSENPILNFKFCKNPVSTITICCIIGFLILGCLNYVLTQFLYGKISQIGISGVQCGAQFLVIILMIFIPRLQKKILNRTIILFAFASYAVFNLLLLVGINNIFCFISFYILAFTSANIFIQILYPMALMSTPPMYISQVAAFPTFARTFGQSLAYSIFSMLLQVSKEGVIYCILICGVCGFVGFLLSIFRLGVGSYENGKKAFRQEQVRKLEIDTAYEGIHEVLEDIEEGCEDLLTTE
ncbi:Major facilitator superfamily protein [Spironucleus salmonicida]|uniref:Major facilitator superfamily protein n=1 Tax=Spironucleus salmonicida TaxID=348837 RepID=V6M726_9EUKA|nr:Major facilitator superfamily protein [Spironucleus salmonicida]|eukprot:EST49219.1 Major facilitator superfamily protein [Spironucleus salmonicida]